MKLATIVLQSLFLIFISSFICNAQSDNAKAELIDSLTKKGDAEFSKKNYRDAVYFYDKVIQECSSIVKSEKGITVLSLACTSQNIYLNRGKAKEKIDDLKGACEDFQKACKGLGSVCMTEFEKTCKTKSSNNIQSQTDTTSSQNFTYLDENLEPATASNYSYKKLVKYREAIIKDSFQRDYYGNDTYSAKPSGLHFCTMNIYFKTGEFALTGNFISDDVDCSKFGGFHGQVLAYYKDGIIKLQRSYEFGKLNGFVIAYDEKGKETKRDEYVKGKLIEKK